MYSNTLGPWFSLDPLSLQKWPISLLKLACPWLEKDAEASPHKQHLTSEDTPPSLLLATRSKTKVKSQHDLCGDMLGLIGVEKD